MLYTWLVPNFAATRHLIWKEFFSMTRGISFTDNDKELIEEIRKFQKAQNLPHFVEAVRVLWKSGLSMCNVVKGLQ